MYLSFVPRILLFSCSGLWCNLHFFQFSPLGWYWIVGFKWMTHWWLGFEWENVLNSTYFCFASKSKMHFHLMHIGKKPCHEWFFLNYYMNAASLKRQLMLSICWVVCLFCFYGVIYSGGPSPSFKFKHWASHARNDDV